MIIYSSFEKTNILEDYIQSLLGKDDQHIIWHPKQKIIINDDHKIIIFMQIVPNIGNSFEFINKNKVNIFVCNTEQATYHNEGFIYNIRPFFELIKNENIFFGIVDYSEQNIEIIKNDSFFEENQIEFYYIPYQYSERENNNLLSYVDDDKMKNICHCGALTKRRNNIMKKICDEHFIKTNIVTNYGKQRDMQLMNYKILLNVSLDENYNIYEHIRCDRLIFSKKIIVSEFKKDYEKLDISEFVVWSSVDDIGDNIIYVLNNYDELVSKITDEKINDITQKRKNIYHDFLRKFSQ